MNEVKSPKRMYPRNYAVKIANATGYRPKTVYAVRQGRHTNPLIGRLLDLAISDRLAFARELEKLHEAQSILNQI